MATHSEPILLVEWACVYSAWSNSSNRMRSLCAVIVIVFVIAAVWHVLKALWEIFHIPSNGVMHHFYASRFECEKRYCQCFFPIPTWTKQLWIFDDTSKTSSFEIQKFTGYFSIPKTTGTCSWNERMLIIISFCVCCVCLSVQVCMSLWSCLALETRNDCTKVESIFYSKTFGGKWQLEKHMRLIVV